MSSDAIVGAAVVGVVSPSFSSLGRARPRKRHPINFFQVHPRTPSWAIVFRMMLLFLLYEFWFRQYGPLISLRSGLDRYVVIGSHKAAIKIMEKKGGALADRPRLVAAGEMLSRRDLGAFLMPAGERFKRTRKVLHTHFQPKTIKAYQSTQVLSTCERVLMGLLESPAQFQNHALICVLGDHQDHVWEKNPYASVTSRHGSNPQVILELCGCVTSRCLPRGQLALVENLPWYGRNLRQGWYTFPLTIIFPDSNVTDHAFKKFCTERSDSGSSFSKFLLAGEANFSMNETEIAFLAGSLFSAGSHTTALANCIVMMPAALHPDAQAAVQAELDSVIGTGRLPTFDDEECLPLLRAFILESQRWRPQAPLGFAHRATEDIIWTSVICLDLITATVLKCFQGDYRIPAGTLVYGNHWWAISRDPEDFPEADKFDLTRWLTADGNVREDLKFPYFGFGRRVCPGQHIANKRISVDASKPVYDLGYIDNPQRHPEPIVLHFKPRVPTETLKAMIEESAA